MFKSLILLQQSELLRTDFFFFLVGSSVIPNERFGLYQISPPLLEAEILRELLHRQVT